MFKRMPLVRISVVMLAFAALSICTAPRAFGQDQGADQGGGDQDPPSRVARLSYVGGSVSFQPAGADDWGTAEMNRPVTTGDKVWADQDSRAEIRLGGSVMRLSANTAFTFLNLTDTAAQMSVSEGEVNFHLRRLADGQSFEIDTPNLAFTVLRPGDYTIIVDENGDTTWATVRSGDAEVTGGGQAFPLHAGQLGTFTGTDTLAGNVDQAEGPDDFENWAIQRNAAFDRPPRPYVSDQMVGYEDLEANGEWRDDPQYGHVWAPRVEAGWAPYQNGHWAWVAPWGWTWVDDAPWGFAPFHYGRWVTVGGGWVWTPGPVVVGVRPVYAPALVAWVGSPGVGIAIGGGAVGVAWFPLGPREVYVPPYHVSERYVTNVNVTNTVVERTTVVNVYHTTVINKTVVNTTYVNRSATVVTSSTAFTSAQPVRANVVHVDAAVVARAPVGTYGGAGVAPVRASLVARAGGPPAKAPPAALQSRAIVAKTPPPKPPVPFAAQQKEIAANGGRPLDAAKINQVRATEPTATRAAVAAPVRVAPAAKPAPITALKKPATPVAKPPAPNRPGNAPAANAPANRPGNAPGNAPAANAPANRPGEAPAAPNRPANAPGNAPANANRPPNAKPANAPNRPPAANAPATKPSETPAAPNRPANAPGNAPANANRPGNPPANRPAEAPANRPPAANAPANRPPVANTPANRPPAANEKPATQPGNRPPAETNRPEANRPGANEQNRPAANNNNKPAEKPAPKNETQQQKSDREKRERENKPQ
jgi:FecR protein